MCVKIHGVDSTRRFCFGMQKTIIRVHQGLETIHAHNSYVCYWQIVMLDSDNFFCITESNLRVLLFLSYIATHINKSQYGDDARL